MNSLDQKWGGQVMPGTEDLLKDVTTYNGNGGASVEKPAAETGTEEPTIAGQIATLRSDNSNALAALENITDPEARQEITGAMEARDKQIEALEAQQAEEAKAGRAEKDKFDPEYQAQVAAAEEQMAKTVQLQIDESAEHGSGEEAEAAPAAEEAPKQEDPYKGVQDLDNLRGQLDNYSWRQVVEACGTGIMRSIPDNLKDVTERLRDQKMTELTHRFGRSIQLPKSYGKLHPGEVAGFNPDTGTVTIRANKKKLFGAGDLTFVEVPESELEVVETPLDAATRVIEGTSTNANEITQALETMQREGSELIPSAKLNQAIIVFKALSEDQNATFEGKPAAEFATRDFNLRERAKNLT